MQPWCTDHLLSALLDGPTVGILVETGFAKLGARSLRSLLLHCLLGLGLTLSLSPRCRRGLTLSLGLWFQRQLRALC